MMPIKMSSLSFKDEIATNLHGYIATDPCQEKQICYLSIHESFVKKGRSQRRPGLHIESAGKCIGGMTKTWYAWNIYLLHQI